MKVSLNIYDKPITADDAEIMDTRILDAMRVQVKALAKEASFCYRPDVNGEYTVITLSDGGALVYPASVVEAVTDFGQEGRRSIAVYPLNTAKYARLERAAQLLNEKTGTRDFYVGVTYFDYGQDWKWTTVLRRLPDKSFGDAVQYFYPVDQEAVLYCKDSQLPQIIDRILEARKK